MKTYPVKRIRKVLLALGLQPNGAGNGSGHDLWSDACGRRCTPVFRHRDLPYSYLYALGHQLEAQGICTRADFLKSIKHRG